MTGHASVNSSLVEAAFLKCAPDSRNESYTFRALGNTQMFLKDISKDKERSWAETATANNQPVEQQTSTYAGLHICC